MGSEPLLSGDTGHAFTYRVRVTNRRGASIQVLGRGWDIVDATGALGGCGEGAFGRGEGCRCFLGGGVGMDGGRWTAFRGVLTRASICVKTCAR
jgi:hypothetical protein